MTRSKLVIALFVGALQLGWFVPAAQAAQAVSKDKVVARAQSATKVKAKGTPLKPCCRKKLRQSGQQKGPVMYAKNVLHGAAHTARKGAQNLGHLLSK